jgi:Ran GTPase-activating protein (RanGAP) involved in mRNA processing and transport
MPSALERAIAEVRAGTAAEVIFEEQEIGEAGTTQLADALRTNTSVEKLNLYGNSIADAGATQLADRLRTNTSVRLLDLGGSSIGEAGATQLADALRTYTSV